eukprot:scaffold31708_cov242-Isochrysis_galbana.AAC.2
MTKPTRPARAPCPRLRPSRLPKQRRARTRGAATRSLCCTVPLSRRGYVWTTKRETSQRLHRAANLKRTVISQAARSHLVASNKGVTDDALHTVSADSREEECRLEGWARVPLEERRRFERRKPRRQPR